jgi:hypothetical protein
MCQLTLFNKRKWFGALYNTLRTDLVQGQHIAPSSAKDCHSVAVTGRYLSDFTVMCSPSYILPDGGFLREMFTAGFVYRLFLHLH